MTTNGIRTQPTTEAALLLAEVGNEPQWIVWPDAAHEAAWADEELAREVLAGEAFAAHRTEPT